MSRGEGKANNASLAVSPILTVAPAFLTDSERDIFEFMERKRMYFSKNVKKRGENVNILLTKRGICDNINM